MQRVQGRTEIWVKRRTAWKLYLVGLTHGIIVTLGLIALVSNASGGP